MQQTLRFSKKRLGICQSSNLAFSCSTPDESCIARLPTRSTQVNVDHIIGLDDPFQPILVVGLGRIHSKWSCIRLLAQLQNPTKQQTWPIRQLASICKNARTRYGYIQTEAELVACRFSKAADGLVKTEIMPVPWTKHGVHTLTTELALWWLCMLAMSPSQNRNIADEADVVEINQWDEVELHWSHGTGLRHRYSNFEKPKDPPLPPPPPPGTDVLSPGSIHALFENMGTYDSNGVDWTSWVNFNSRGKLDTIKETENSDPLNDSPS